MDAWVMVKNISEHCLSQTLLLLTSTPEEWLYGREYGGQ